MSEARSLKCPALAEAPLEKGEVIKKVRLLQRAQELQKMIVEDEKALHLLRLQLHGQDLVEILLCHIENIEKENEGLRQAIAERN
jgi:hypothetical protein